MRQALDVIAGIVSGGVLDTETMRWDALRYTHTTAVRSVLAERYASSVNSEGFFTALNVMSGGMVVPLIGGVLIRDDTGRVLGAAGVSGARSEDDEACAVAGIEALGYPLDLPV